MKKNKKVLIYDPYGQPGDPLHELRMDTSGEPEERPAEQPVNTTFPTTKHALLVAEFVAKYLGGSDEKENR